MTILSTPEAARASALAEDPAVQTPAQPPSDLKIEAASLVQDMTFGEIHGVKHPVLRAIALMSTSHCEPWTPYWRRLIASVDVPEAGDWGQRAQALLDKKPSTGRAKRRSSSDGSLFLSFAEDIAAAVDADQQNKPNAAATGARVER